PDTSAQWVTLDFPGCMSMPDSPQYVLEKQIGFYSNHPNDTLFAAEYVLDFPSAQITAPLTLHNLAAAVAPNMWIRLVNPEGGLSQLSIMVDTFSAQIQPANGIYQLGNLAVFGKKNLKINGLNQSCDPQRLLVIYGWDCQPYLVPGAPACGTPDTVELLLRPRKPVIELELTEFPVNVPLCDTSDYFVFKLTNADLGFAYLPAMDIELPPGLQLVPGSCQMAYPAGSAYQPIPDPVQAGNQLLQWNLAALEDSIAARGLPSVTAYPNNVVQIRFKVQAGCGAVSNAQLFFGARAEWFCGRPTNSLRNASDPILVEGLEPGYEVQLSVIDADGNDPAPCSDERIIRVSLQASGPALAGDSIYLSLPPGYAYVSGSYLPGPNAPAGPPQTSTAGLRWPLPLGLPPNTPIQFSFKIKTPDAPNCSGAYLRLQTRQQLQAFCATLGGDCPVYVVTGETELFFPPLAPGLRLSDAALTVLPDGKANYMVSVLNPDPSQPQTLQAVQFFYDTNGNGQLDASDVLLYTIGNLNLPVQPGQTLQIPFDGLPGPDSVCQILAVLPTLKNCLCPTDPVLIFNNTVDYAAVQLCVGQSAPLGVPGLDGHAYSWSGAGNLPCTNCPNFDFEPPAVGLYQLTLTDQGAACVTTHHYAVEAVAAPELMTANTNLCQGQSTSLQTSAATNWNWQGPGIANPGAPVQVVQPQTTSWYFVTATNAAGCTLTDSV
ncbi:MAG: hypothetical protein JNK89_08915, partial [Saprospiraceae bacterium]|nr:hypothetical protein [Saprospiraceae bacterium]